MKTIEIEIINPKAINFLQTMQELKLIKIINEKIKISELRGKLNTNMAEHKIDDDLKIDMTPNLKTAFPPIVDESSRIIILGTMPGERSLRLQQYYGHAGNHFWKIMFNLLNRPFNKDYSKRKELLLKNEVTLWDVLENCEGEGSADSNIKNEVANDFATFFIKYPNIKKVYFASQKAESFYKKYVKDNFGLEYHTLPSPSSANTWKTFEEKLEEWKIILD